MLEVGKKAGVNFTGCLEMNQGTQVKRELQREFSKEENSKNNYQLKPKMLVGFTY